MGQTNDKTTHRARAKSDNGGPSRWNDARFVQYELDKAELAQCKAWNLDAEGIWLELLALCDDGYSASVRYDGQSNSYACFLQVRGDPAHVNANLILAGRGSSPAKAVKQAIFKHRAIDASWVQYAERRVEPLDD